MLKVTPLELSIQFGDGFTLSFQRTLRIPDDGRTYPLPPGLGRFPVAPVAKHRDRVPAEWADGDVFIPMYQREALWILFEPRYWKPNAVKIGVGGVNAVSGKPWDEALRDSSNDYLVCPPQPWLDGINAGEGFIRQFVAMPLGAGYTVEAQVTGKEERGGIQVVVYEAKPGRFPDRPPEVPPGILRVASAPMSFGAPEGVMGMGAGGKMRQKIYPDPHGLETWDMGNTGSIAVHIVNSLMYREITGKEPPPSPISAKTYAQHGLPWFDLYDEQMGDVAAPDALKRVKSTAELDQERGLPPQQDDSSISIADEQVKKYDVGSEGLSDLGKP